MSRPFQPLAAAFGVPIRIWVLVAIHAALSGIFLNTVTIREPTILVGAHIALTFAQAALLGQYLAISQLSLRSVAAAAIGLGLLELMVRGVEPERLDRFLFPLGISSTFAWMLVAGVILRVFHVQLNNRTLLIRPRLSSPWNFSIPQVLLITSIVAMALASFNWSRSLRYPRHPEQWIVIGCLFFAPGSLLALWAAFGRDRLLPRSAITIATSAILGLIISTIFKYHYPPWFWPYLISAQSAITLVSLIVVRSCGYRLIRAPLVDPVELPGDGRLENVQRTEGDAPSVGAIPHQLQGDFGVPDRLWLLVAVHVVVTILIATYANLRYPIWSTAVCLGFLFAQAALLGQWVGLSLMSVRSVLGGAAGIAVLQLVVRSLSEAEFLMIGVLVLAGFMLIVGLILHACRVTLQHAAEDSLPLRRHWRFNLSQLFAVTSGLALVVASSSSMRTLEIHAEGIPLIVLGSMTFAPGTLLALWTAFGNGTLALRAPLAIGLTATCTYFVLFAFDRSPPLGFWIGVTVSQATITMLSLFLVRSCGYRFRRRSS